MEVLVGAVVVLLVLVGPFFVLASLLRRAGLGHRAAAVRLSRVNRAPVTVFVARDAGMALRPRSRRHRLEGRP